ncbi:carbohydrate kinase [Luteimonas sp. RD2P54]|uniref:Carbohydrate kinase n=1 Tax=Luteimonas endophytica TaxID=3042023 RepID=A0ABT6J528_9GAMM|nr:carbohydrate kinase [Luteimonas endophytica]MDH5821924.1 carbohydrate kinase [Luteimonas endophytica]
MPAARNAVACFGEALIDFRASSGGSGAPRSFLEQPGGAPANVAVGVARLGGRARFVGMLAEDMFGESLLGALRVHGVDVAQVRRTGAAPTALAFVALDARGERSFSFYRPPAADLLFRAADFDPAAFADLAVFHVCSNSLTEPAIADATLHGMGLATEAGALVSFDLNLRPALWPRGADPRPVLWRALERAHLVKLSREELAFLVGGGEEDAAIRRLFGGAAEALVVTDGPAPIRWWTRERHGTAPVFAVTAIDTTAAGDAFVAGLLWRLAGAGTGAARLAGAFENDAIRRDLLRHAAACGALAVTRHGAFDAMPAAAAVEALARTG